MGCDIHTYVEFATPKTGDYPVYWQNFTRNGGNRNYILFGVLAGVRYPEAQLFQPKGMPEGDYGFWTVEDYWLRIPSAAYPELEDSEGYVSLDKAERWIADGSSIGKRDAKGRLFRVSNPDHHTHSWLTTDELAQALDHYKAEAEKQWPGEADTPPEWLAMLAGMRAFEAAGQMTRLVFWFDN